MKDLRAGLCVFFSWLAATRSAKVDRGDECCRGGRQKLYDRAISQMQQAISIDPANDQAHYNPRRDLQGSPRASVPSEQAVQVRERQPQLSLRLASAYFEAKKLEQARVEFEATVKQEPKAYKAHFRLEMVLEYLSRSLRNPTQRIGSRSRSTHALSRHISAW